MIRLHTNAVNPQPRHIARAIEVLKDGGLIIYATDTVYGLGCDLFNKKAVEKIIRLKGNKKSTNLSFICPDLKDIAQYAHVSTPAYKIMKHLLPGPYTFILEASRLVPKILTEKKKQVGIRVPDNVICHTLLEEFGHPIISTSAKRDDQEFYFIDPDEIEEELRHQVDLFLDSGWGDAEPSSVIDMTVDPAMVIREGKNFDHNYFY